FFPIGAFFKKRRRTITDFDPLHGAVIKLPCFGHIPEIFVAGDRSSAERPFLNGLAERLCSTGFDFGGDEVSHASNCTNSLYRRSISWLRAAALALRGPPLQWGGAEYDVDHARHHAAVWPWKVSPL